MVMVERRDEKRQDENWQQQAACRGPLASIFFPPVMGERPSAKAAREAKARSICAECPVRQPCLAYALRIREPHGVWGGLNEDERRALLKK
jgi:WhiB family transcriptional regulator, redox-sensing transcriptional regulator